MTLINSSVADTIREMVCFGENTSDASIALCAALCSIILYSTVASTFGIPTSESHSLIAGITGAAIAVSGNVSGIRFDAWQKVLYGLLASLILGFVSGLLTCKGVRRAFEMRHVLAMRRAQIFSAAAMSFMHGAQDGQKFIGILFLGLIFSGKLQSADNTRIPVWLMLLCSLVMALGTCVGGKKIIQSIGTDMVRLNRRQGFSADLGAAACLLFCSIYGIPVSTTHTKVSAILGAGTAEEGSLASVDLSLVREMLFAWIFTFPVSGLLGYFLTKLFL
jgi:PiT family inorganic phosphate transporter